MVMRFDPPGPITVTGRQQEDRCFNYIRTLHHEDLIAYAMNRNFNIQMLEAERREWRQRWRRSVLGLIAMSIALIGALIWAGIADTHAVSCESRATKSLEDAQAEASRRVQEAETRELDAFRKLEQLREGLEE